MKTYIEILLQIAIPNKYTEWYIHIINHSKYITGYYEKHHILPKCFKLCGEKDQENLVKLTAKEHFICHKLLSKMFTEKQQIQMQHAFCMMSTRENIKITPHNYQLIKNLRSKILTENNHNRNGDQSRLAWSKSTKERRDKQAEIMAEVNRRTKSKPKEFREYECIYCRDTFYREEHTHHHRLVSPFCSRTCIMQNTLLKKGFSRESKIPKEKKPKIPWNKGIKGTGFGDITRTNPMKNPELVEKMLDSRKRNRELKCASGIKS